MRIPVIFGLNNLYPQTISEQSWKGNPREQPHHMTANWNLVAISEEKVSSS